MDDFKSFSDESYSLWSAVFDSLINNGVKAEDAHVGAKEVLMQVLMAYGSLKSDYYHSSHSSS